MSESPETEKKHGTLQNIPEQKGNLWALCLENDGEVVREKAEGFRKALVVSRP